MTVTTDTARTSTAARTSTGTGSSTGTGALPLRPRPVRRVARTHPGGRGVSYSGAPAPLRLSGAAHTVPSLAVVHRRRRVAAGLLVAVVLGLAALGLVGLRQAGAAQVPVATAVVQVQAGESLSELAVRVAPEAPTSDVVRRIQSLNDLSGASVRVGQSLVVPVG